jgi:hypothetical protein
MKKFAMPLYGMLCLCVSLSVSCNDDTPISSRPDLIDPNDLGKRLQTTTMVASDTSASAEINSYGGAYLPLGRFDNLESQILIRFRKVSLEDTVRLIAATLKMPAHTSVGDGPGFEATMHVVTTATPWDSNQVKWGEVTFDPIPFSRQQIQPSPADTTDVDTVSFALDSTVVKSWRDPNLAANGALIRASNAAFLKMFHSAFSVLKQPILELITHKPSSATNDTTRLNLGPTVFVFQRLAPLPPGPIYVGNGERHTGVLYFNLAAIPQKATISRAVLTVEVDTLSSLLTSSGVTMRAFAQDADYQLDPNRIFAHSDSLSLTQLLQLPVANASTKNIAPSFEVTNVVQFWVSDSTKNYGVALLPASPRSDLSRVALYSREWNPSRAPQLQITYTTPPGVQ